MSADIIQSHIPEWALGITWYQIMPERFRNGDPNNTPNAADQKYAWPHDPVSPLELHPWGSDWYRLQSYEQKNGKDIWHNLHRRRYGGDLLGIIDQLDYLQDLGIDALYLNPVFHAPSHHKYDAASYHHVDPAFGPDPDGDRELIAREVPHDPSTWEWTSADEMLLRLIEQVHKRGMYIILDGVFNHMGLASWAYQDILRNQNKSPFGDWMDVVSWADELDSKTGSGSNSEFKSLTPLMAELDKNYGSESPFKSGFAVKTWEGFLELPEWRQNRRGIVDGPRDYIFNITRRWMDPFGNGDTFHGVDGWRLDVAYCIKHPFWKAWRRHVKTINPQACLVAEVIDSVKKTLSYVKGDEFDAAMNYNFQFACDDFFIRIPERIGATGFAGRLEQLMTAFPHPVAHVMQNLLGSHDTDRMASRIVNRRLDAGKNWWDYFTRSNADNPRYLTCKPNKMERRIQQLMIFTQFTLPGSPMIYYGDESGMWGANDPCCRKPMVWPDIEYEPERSRPDESEKKQSLKTGIQETQLADDRPFNEILDEDRTLKSQPIEYHLQEGLPTENKSLDTKHTEDSTNEVQFDHGMYRFYQSLISARKSCPALKLGDYTTLLTDDRLGVLVFRRRYRNQDVIVAIRKGLFDRDDVAETEASENEIAEKNAVEKNASENVAGENVAGEKKASENVAGENEVAQNKAVEYQNDNNNEAVLRITNRPEKPSLTICLKPLSAVILGDDGNILFSLSDNWQSHLI